MKRLILILAALLVAVPAQAREQWTKVQANAWQEKQPWLVGSNYTPASAIN
ncbi:1,4-beta-xylanase, partial [Sphingomonas sp. JC676]|nr:1,4-beta-xylanase [Sphingomonas sp. JC676]